MRTSGKNCGFTLIEMLLVVALIVIFVSVVVGVARRIDEQGKERLTRDTLALIGDALEQFRDFGYEYKDPDFAGLVFPLDCNGFFAADLEQILWSNFYPSAVSVVVAPGAPTYDPNFSGSGMLYFALSQVPDCRATLDKIDKSLLTNTINGMPIIITVKFSTTSQTTLFIRIIDPWKMPLRYDYYPDFADFGSSNWSAYLVYRDSAKRTFPLITSAGPDKKFDTFDDISNIQ